MQRLEKKIDFLVRTLICNRDDQRTVLDSMDKTAKVWKSENGTESYILTGHEDLVSSPVYNLNEKRIATAGQNGTV